MSYKIGYIGFGGMISGHHLKMARRDDNPFEAIAAYDIDPARREAAVREGLAAYDSLDAFLAAGGYDLVVVGTANNFHCEFASRAMEAGYNVMVEKPAARNAAEVRTMIDTAHKTGKLFTVHQNRRWDDDYVTVRQAIADDRVGKPYMIESRVHPENGDGDMYNWRGMRDHGGGMLLDWGVHMLDQLLFMADEPVRTVSANVFSLWSEEVDDYAKVILTFESGLVAQMEVTTYAPIPLPRWAVYGDRGAMVLRGLFGDPLLHVRRIREDETTRNLVDAFERDRVVKREQSRHKIQSFEEFDLEKVNVGWDALYRNLAGVLAGTEELIVKPEQVLACMNVIEAAFKSSAEGVTVRL